MKLIIFLLTIGTLFGREPHPITKINKWRKEERALMERSDSNDAIVSSASIDGVPHSRMMRIFYFDRRKGALFFAHKDTRTAQNFDQNPYASLHLRLPKTRRQVVLFGRVEKVLQADREKLWRRLSRTARLLFLVSNHVGRLDSTEILEKRKNLLEQELPKEIPMPETFIGYCLFPTEIMFYESRPRECSRKEVALFTDEGWSTWLVEP